MRSQYGKQALQYGSIAIFQSITRYLALESASAAISCLSICPWIPVGLCILASVGRGMVMNRFRSQTVSVPVFPGLTVWADEDLVVHNNDEGYLSGLLPFLPSPPSRCAPITPPSCDPSYYVKYGGEITVVLDAAGALCAPRQRRLHELWCGLLQRWPIQHRQLLEPIFQLHQYLPGYVCPVTWCCQSFVLLPSY